MHITITIERVVIEQLVRPEADPQILAALGALREDVRHLLTQEGAHYMAVSAAIQAFSDALNAATDKIAARIQALIDKLNAAGTLSPEDSALLQAEVDRLTALGQDAENPVPPEV